MADGGMSQGGGGGLAAGSNGGGTAGSGGGGPYSAARHKLAEYRYGREEMLGLFEMSSEIPGDLRDMSIYVSRAQIPLALQPLSEEEQVCV